MALLAFSITRPILGLSIPSSCFAVSLFVSCIVGRSMASMMRSSARESMPPAFRSDREVSRMPLPMNWASRRSLSCRRSARRRAAASRLCRRLRARSTISAGSGGVAVSAAAGGTPPRIVAASTMARHVSKASCGSAGAAARAERIADGISIVTVFMIVCVLVMLSVQS